MRDGGPVVVVAGGGGLPVLLADALAQAGRPSRILALRGFASPAIRRRADRTMSLLDVSGMLAQLDAWAPACVTLAGGVSRPSPAALAGGVSAWRNRREIAEVFSRGDDHLLRGVVRLLEERGHVVVGAHEIAPALLPRAGTLGVARPGPEHERAIRVGFSCLRDLAPYDVGQALVVVEERVVAIEGPEGTDRMLARAGGLGFGRGLLPMRRKPSGGVLVKAAKAGQDRRVDLAAVGPRTIEAAHRAGLAGVAIGAGATLVIEREAMIARADRLGLFLTAVEPDDPRVIP